MCATTGPLAGRRPRRRCSTTRPTAAASTRSSHLAERTGILQADVHAGFNDLYDPRRKPGPATSAGCPVSFADITPWDRCAMAHGRRKLFDLAQLARTLLAAGTVRRIEAIFDVERTINSLPADQRLAVRQKHVAPLAADLETWMRAARGKMSRHADAAKAVDHMLKRWDGFSRFTTDGRICLSSNAAERALHGAAPGRKAWLFAGPDRGGERTAAMHSPIITAKLNGTNPRAWLADALRRISDHPASRLHELLPWNWRKPAQDAAAAACPPATAALAGWMLNPRLPVCSRNQARRTAARAGARPSGRRSERGSRSACRSRSWAWAGWPVPRSTTPGC